MKTKLINTKEVKEVLFKEEHELAKQLFGIESYPLGFISAVQLSMNIANIVYDSTADIEIAIKELDERLDNIERNVVKCAYYFTLSFLHYLNDDLFLSLLACACIKPCYKEGVSDNA